MLRTGKSEINSSKPAFIRCSSSRRRTLVRCDEFIHLAQEVIWRQLAKNRENALYPAKCYTNFMRIIKHGEGIWTIPDFLSAERCRRLIGFSEGFGFEEASVGLSSGAKMMKGVRDNFRAEVDDDELASQMWREVEAEFPARIQGVRAVGLNPHFRFYRYENGQKFKRHIDGRQKVGELESRVTWMIYLNDDFAGGSTAFDDIEIRPERGTALLFIHEQKHEGCPVERGRKYVLRSDVLFARDGASEDAS